MNFDDFLQLECPVLLSSKVKTLAIERDASALISEALEEIDLKGRPWDRFHETLVTTDLHQLQEIESRIDVAIISKDYEAARRAIAEYKALILGIKLGVIMRGTHT